MKTTRTPAVLAVLAAVALLTADASAYYNPRTGRFLQRDPGPGEPRRVGVSVRPADGQFAQRDPGRAGEFEGVPGLLPGTGSLPQDATTQYSDGMNLYEYVSGRPLIAVDPQGTKKQCCCTNAPSLCAVVLSGWTVESSCKTARLPALGRYVCWARLKAVRVEVVHSKGADVTGCHLRQAAFTYTVADGRPSGHFEPDDFGPPETVKARGLIEYHNWWFLDSPSVNARTNHLSMHSFSAAVWVREQPLVSALWSWQAVFMPPIPPVVTGPQVLGTPVLIPRPF